MKQVSERPGLEASMSRNEWEETLGESQLVAASHSMKPKTSAPFMQLGGGGLKGNQLTSTAKVKSSLRASAEPKKSTFSIDDQNSMRSGSKLTDSNYDDDFMSESMQQSHMSASHNAGTRANANRMSNLSKPNNESATLDPPKSSGSELQTVKKNNSGGGTTNNFSQKRKSAETLPEKYSPIKEATKHKEDHSLEENGDDDDDDDEDYTSADASESTMKYKYTNNVAKSRQMQIDDSAASSSMMMSSAGKDSSGLRGKLVSGAGKTHINVGNIHSSATKGQNLAVSSNLDETEEEDSESMSMSVSAPG